MIATALGYVFGKAFWWILGSLLVGGVIGWFANGWRRKEFTETTVDSSETLKAESTRLSGRVDELETELAECRRSAADAADTTEARNAEVARLRGHIDELESDLAACRSAAESQRANVVASPSVVATPVAEAAAESATITPLMSAAPETTAPSAPAPDLDAASAVLGRRPKMDDLKVVEGIGPKIEELLHDAGITTWAELADAATDRLTSILTNAGDRFRMHDPGSWPTQAGLLATGQWQEFKDLTDRLTGGR